MLDESLIADRGLVVPSSPDDEPRRRSGPKRRAKVKKRHTVARVLTVAIVVLAMTTGLSVVYLFRHLSGNLNVANYEDQLQDRPEKAGAAGSALNILIMGNDTREGQGNAIDQEEGGGSDTTILIHLSADREHAYGVSIPRDSMVDRPACKRGEIPAASYVQWNEAFDIGGPACTIQQFEQLTDIHLDHYVVVEFSTFQGIVDAVGGVEVCIPETIDDREHGIYLEEGTRKITGEESLAYVRVRSNVGNGSDIGRIKRQQAFVASMVAEILSAKTLTRPDRLVRVLDAATEGLTVDKGLEDLRKMAELGFEFRNINPDNIQFLTIPWITDPQDANRVVWADEASRVWRKLRNDEPLSQRLTSGAIRAGKPSGSGDGDGDPSASPTASSTPEDDVAREEAESAGLCT